MLDLIGLVLDIVNLVLFLLEMVWRIFYAGPRWVIRRLRRALGRSGRR